MSKRGGLRMPPAGARHLAWIGALALACAQAAEPVPPTDTGELELVVIRAREARYVAPTTRDQIGRIWAPVMINGRGPFRLALDTGASGVGIASAVLPRLGPNVRSDKPFNLRGISGTMTVSSVRVDSLSIGDLWLKSKLLPVLPDAMGGADGVLGGDSLEDMRVYISFRYDRIEITRSADPPLERGMAVVPFTHTPGMPVVVDATVSGIPIKAVINTGGQNTMGNRALHERMQRGRISALVIPSDDKVTDITQATTAAAGQSGATLRIADLRVRYPHVSFADFAIFKAWGLDSEPAMIIGMDTLGLFDTVVIDYRRKELQLRLHNSTS